MGRFPTQSCRHCGQSFYSACTCSGARWGDSTDTKEEDLLRRINELLARDLSVPGRREAALRRLRLGID